jgi:hypothetical protein
MSVAFVSTMNQKLYDLYGKRFINEFISSADNKIKLFIIFEGKVPNEIIGLSNNIYSIPLLSEKHNHFVKFFGSLTEARGIRVRIFEENGQKKINVTSDYRFDAIRFSFKPFAIHQSLQYIPEELEYLIWTDADLRCKKNFVEEDLLQFLPANNELMTYLGRENNYSECGFLGFNIKNPSFYNYINRVIDIYTSGEIFSLREWHDSWIWDHVRNEFEQKNILFKNISGRGYSHHHPFINSGLEKFFDHLKGPNRKKEGRSPDKDYLK